MLIEYEPNKCFNTTNIVTIDVNEPTTFCRDQERYNCLHHGSCDECPQKGNIPYTIVITFSNDKTRTIEKNTKEDVDTFMNLLKHAMSLCNEQYAKIEQFKD